ncbi:unnamed protein product [Penicillium olsonii]|nr:unnamed protein product [Penicillium olsonii]
MLLSKSLLRAAPAKPLHLRPSIFSQIGVIPMNSQKRQGHGGRGRGRGRGRGGSRPSHPSVPPSRSINPGTPVNIILKADQPTGRTVSGTVSDLLTRGDHPRGVKVRLTDGRVGRVQSIGTGEPTHEAGDDTEGTQPGEPGIQLRSEGGDSSGRRNRFTSRDMRLDGPEEPSAEPLGLDMYIRPAKGKKKSQKAQAAQGLGEESHASAKDAGAAAQKPGSLKCPVCADFEGDEAAVAHHVAGHFGE